MTATNTVEVEYCGGSKVIRTRSLTQYDYGQVLKIKGVDLPDTFEVHFSNSLDGEAVSMIGENGVVAIPDECLLVSGIVYCWLFLHTGTDDGESVIRFEIPIKPKALLCNEEPDEVEHDLVSDAIAALNAGVAAVQEALQSIEDLNVIAETLDPGSDATVSKTVDEETGIVTLTFGVPKGDAPIRGEDYWTEEDKQNVVEEAVDAVSETVTSEVYKQSIAEMVSEELITEDENGLTIRI